MKKFTPKQIAEINKKVKNICKQVLSELPEPDYSGYITP